MQVHCIIQKAFFKVLEVQSQDTFTLFKGYEIEKLHRKFSSVDSFYG